MQVYKSKYGKLPGTSYKEVVKLARRQYHAIQHKSPRRQAYVRSKYFSGSKVFINQFWLHLDQKTRADSLRRVRLFTAAIDTIINNSYDSGVIQNPNAPTETLHRFIGITKDGILFCVQIRENKKTNRKDFMSVFPIKGTKK